MKNLIKVQHRIRQGLVLGLVSAWGFLAGSTALAASNPPAATDVWPEFRGPTGNGESTTTNLPLKWSETENVRWKTPIHGRAWSCPVVWEKQIWLTTATEDGRQLYAVCVNRETGKIDRDLKLFDIDTPQFAHSFNTYASPTPAIEEGRVYVTFGSPGTACLDTASGQVLWQRKDFVCNHFRGAGSSPILADGRVYLPYDGSDFQFLVALDKQTGKTVWRTERTTNFRDLNGEGKPTDNGDFRKAFSTPVRASFAGKTILISLASKALFAYDPASGQELWRVEVPQCHSGSARPVVDQDLIYFCAGFPKGELWAVRPGGKGTVTDPQVAWKVTRDVPLKPSVLLVEGLIYMVDDNGVATCLEAKDGAVVWRERIGGHFSSSPIHSGDRIYCFSEEGKATVFATGRAFKLLAANELEDGFMASPAVAGKALFLRTKAALYRIEAQ
jgi:outer membrane protein assembly factor BamB